MGGRNAHLGRQHHHRHDESLTLRVLFDHDAESRDTKWTIAAYESPVSDRIWHATATAATPVEIVGTPSSTLWPAKTRGPPGWGPTSRRRPSPRPPAPWPTPAGRKQSKDVGSSGLRRTTTPPASSSTPSPPRNTTPAADLDHVGRQHPPPIHLGPALSPHTPAGLLQDIAAELAHGQSVRQTPHPRPASRQTSPSAQAPASCPPHPPGCSSRVLDACLLKNGPRCLSPDRWHPAPTRQHPSPLPLVGVGGASPPHGDLLVPRAVRAPTQTGPVRRAGATNG
ncbi:DUF317 domain-containing protein [Streptomyces halobius]|uniref:DUF317 domain-containing protein n=1 Tax=Streptomyces halobius TaxID=2879846 RepID=A0ABY4M3H1_9ACTN|nr:DUF317 domain-containing protein [Streptomyces halobius]